MDKVVYRYNKVVYRYICFHAPASKVPQTFLYSYTNYEVWEIKSF